jgi:hypothetical protein
MGCFEVGGMAKMKDNKGFAFTSIAFLLAVPAVVLVAGLVSMMEIGDTTTSMVISSDSVYYPCEDIKHSFEFSAENYARVYRTNLTGITQRFESNWMPMIDSYFDDAGIDFDASSINISFDVSTNSIKYWSENQTNGVNITVTGKNGDIICELVSGPLTVSIGEDTSGPIFLISSPGNHTHCEPTPTQDLNITLTYAASEPVTNVVYSLNGGANQSATSGMNLTFTAADNMGPNNLTIYGTDSYGNNGSSTRYFYIKNWAYVSAYSNNSGIVTYPENATSASDSGASANITETYASQTSADNHPINREFVSNSDNWTASDTGTGITNSWDASEGVPPGAILTNIAGTSQLGNGTWETSQGSFNHTAGEPVDASISFRYKFDTGPGSRVGSTRRFTFWLETPETRTNYSLYNVSLPNNDVDWTWVGQLPAVVNLPTGYFNESGDYKFRIISELSTASTGNPDVSIWFDNINVVLTRSSSEGFQHDVNFTVDDTADFVNWSNHELQSRYRMLDTDPESINVYTWNTSSNDFEYQFTQGANTSFNTFSYFLTLEEWNNGNVWVSYRDSDQEDISTASSLLIDYHRVC